MKNNQCINPSRIQCSDGPPPRPRTPEPTTFSAWRRYPKKLTAPAVKVKEEKK